MANVFNSANMNLPIPVVGTDPGPDYASNVNASLTLVDSHDHSAGKGVPINPAGININSDLSFGGNNLTLARSLRLSPQSAPLNGASDLGCIYESGVDLYYNDGSGNQVRITQSGGVAGSPGSIANLTSPASASYVSASSTFVWQSAANTPANLDAASILIRNLTAGSNAITLQAPVALGSNYTLTLPALPASQKFMTLDAAGNISAPWAVDGSTIVVSSNTITIPFAGITSSQIAAGAVTATQIATGAVTDVKIATATITIDKLAAMSSGTSVSAGGLAAAASCGTFNTTSSSFGTVTNQSITITTTGRPVLLMLTGDTNTTNGSFIGLTTTTAGAGEMDWRFQRAGATIASGQILINGLAATGDDLRIPPGPQIIDPVAAGTYTYTFQVRADGSGSTARVNQCLIKAFEI